MRSAALPLLVAALLTACSQPAYREYSEEVADVALIKPPPGVATSAQAVAVAASDAPASAPEPSPTPRVPAGPPMLAYSYKFGLTLPPRRVPELQARHETACARAGHQLCQVVSSSLDRTDNDTVRAELVLRAAPAWLKSFREGLAGEARAAGGRLVRSEVESEDLSRQIVDTEAQLRARTTLRDRLQALLASRPGKLSDLLDVERELARVQGEIDSMQSQLAVMRGRVATSELTLTYASPGAAAVTDGGSMLGRAFADFADIVAQSVAGMVYFIAWVLPWAAMLAAALWLLRKRIPRLRWPFRRRERSSPPGTGGAG